jgi:hypothetical protein
MKGNRMPRNHDSIEVGESYSRVNKDPQNDGMSEHVWKIRRRKCR